MVHQCAQFSEDPRKPHGEDVKSKWRYLKGTDKIGIYIYPRDSNFKVWVGSDFSGNWFPEEDKDDSDKARSQSGFVVTYLVCPVMWTLKPQCHSQA